MTAIVPLKQNTARVMAVWNAWSLDGKSARANDYLALTVRGLTDRSHDESDSNKLV